MRKQPPPPHIVQLPENTRGCDYVIGDVHGSVSALKKVLATLQPGDRLFIVGDLIDRGEDSARVIEAIIAANKDKDPPVVYPIRGNHEDMFLAAEREAEVNGGFDAEPRSVLENYYENGGGWIATTGTTRLKTCAEFVRQLPYIILVGGLEKKENAFLVCHADMPLSDEQLKRRLDKAVPYLTPSEIQHAVWIRENEMRSKKPVRTAESVRTYCGHNIVTSGVQAVRKKTNHVNLDGAAFLDNALLVVNHTESIAAVVTSDFQWDVTSDPKTAKEIYVTRQVKEKMLHAINTYLEAHKQPVASIASAVSAPAESLPVSVDADTEETESFASAVSAPAESPSVSVDVDIKEIKFSLQEQIESFLQKESKKSTSISSIFSKKADPAVIELANTAKEILRDDKKTAQDLDILLQTLLEKSTDYKKSSLAGADRLSSVLDQMHNVISTKISIKEPDEYGFSEITTNKPTP